MGSAADGYTRRVVSVLEKIVQFASDSGVK
jgi:hypothetical protein